jgi:hypothetical protein
MKKVDNPETLIDEYLAAVDRSLHFASRGRREQIIDDLRNHIRDSREGGSSENGDTVRAVLERIGNPEAIADAERVGTAARTSSADRWVPWLLLLGGLAALVGWIVGVILLWRSTVWRTRDKVIGTFLLPGGLLPAAISLGLSGGGSSETCSGEGGPGHRSVVHCTASVAKSPVDSTVILVLLVLIPIVTALWLWHAHELE